MSEGAAPSWPSAQVDLDLVRAWIATVMPGPLVSVDLVTIHRVNEWGVTARFAMRRDDATSGGAVREVVFKANALPPSFTGAAAYDLLARCCPDQVPGLIAAVDEPGKRWALFRVFTGELVAEIGELAPVVAVARTLAVIQAAVADHLAHQPATLPTSDVAAIPAMLAEIREVLTPVRTDSVFAAANGLPDDWWERLDQAGPEIRRWVTDLQAAEWPDTIHHVDLHPANAVRRPDGSILIFDWEEADLGFPAFSLDKLLLDVERWWGRDGTSAVRDAYLDAIPWGDPADQPAVFATALRLSPIRHAHADLQFARALGWEPEAQLASWLRLALRRWDGSTTD